MRIIGLIPARKESKRIPGKNLAMLAGKTLLQRAIDSAKESGAFDTICVSSDWDACLEIATRNNIRCLARPQYAAVDDAHDYLWVEHAMRHYPKQEIFVILRPTSPFRTADTITRAIDSFINYIQPVDSMRAVEVTKAHPGKAWFVKAGPRGTYMVPYETHEYSSIQPYDLPTQVLPEIHSQNACIHIAWVSTLRQHKNVSGNRIHPFFTDGDEGIDINTPEDLEYAEWKMAKKAEEAWRDEDALWDKAHEKF